MTSLLQRRSLEASKFTMEDRLRRSLAVVVVIAVAMLEG